MTKRETLQRQRDKARADRVGVPDDVPLYERFAMHKRELLAQGHKPKSIRKLALRFKKAEVLLAENTPESRKRYKQMSEHSYGRDRHNLYGFWNGTGKTERKKPMKTAKHSKGITTLSKLRGETYRPYTKQ